MGREDPQLKLRLTELLKERITDAAKANGRSVNAEIVARLEASEKSGSEVADEWKRRWTEERESFQRMEKLYDNMFDVAMSYRELNRGAKGQTLQYVSMIRSLASILLNLEERPSADAIDLASRLKAAADKTYEALTTEETEKAAPSLQKALDQMTIQMEALGKVKD
jgi:hypothetical protein